MRKHFLSLSISVFTLLHLGAPWSIAGELSTYANLRKGPLAIIVRFEDGKEAWAQTVLDEIPRYLSLVERYLKRAFPYRDHIIIEGIHEGLSHRDGQYIYLNYDNDPVDSPAVLFHELDHFWFYYYTSNSSSEWVIEGVSSFLPVAMRHQGLLPESPYYREAIDRSWGLNAPLSYYSSEDVPLSPFNESKRNILYTKSYRLQYLFNCIMGDKRYHKFLVRLAATKKQGLASILRLLKQMKGRNWRQDIRGWVLGTDYRRVSLSDFWTDADSDGLANAHEFCHRTDASNYDSDGDLLPDGAELLLGTDPNGVNPDGLALLQRYGPFTDGSNHEWDYFNKNTFTDPAGDSTGPGWADMIEFSYVITNNRLAIILRTAEPPPSDSNVFFDLLVDTDFDGHTNEEFAFMLYNPANAWHYSVATKTSETLPELKAGRGDFIEMSIPLDSIPSSSFQILPIIRNHPLAQNYDEWARWQEINK